MIKLVDLMTAYTDPLRIGAIYIVLLAAAWAALTAFAVYDDRRAQASERGETDMADHTSVPLPAPPRVAVGTCRACHRIVPLDSHGRVAEHTTGPDSRRRPCYGTDLTPARRG